jgi:hypothetical protein
MLSVAASSAALMTSLSAMAGIVTLNGGGTDNGKAFSCSFNGNVNVTSGGQVIIQCDDTLNTNGTPPPTTPPPTTPPPVTQGPVVGCAVAGTIQRATLGPWGSSQIHHGLGSTVYSYPLPKNPAGIHTTGYITHTSDPGSPSEMTIEWTISKCPGDITYASTAPVITGGRSSGTYFPCRAVSGVPSGGISWSVVGSAGACQVNNTENWYLNIRYISGCGVGQDCPLAYAHQEL